MIFLVDFFIQLSTIMLYLFGISFIWMQEISREAGGLPMIYLLKSAILIFAILLFLQVISKIIDDLLGTENFFSLERDQNSQSFLRFRK